MHLHQPFDERQADPQSSAVALERGLQLAEEVENLRQRRRGDADPVVANTYEHVAILALDGHLDAAARLGELRGVVEEIPEDLSQPCGIGIDDHRLGQMRHRELVAAFHDAGPARLDRRVHDLGQFDAFFAKLQPVARDATHVQQVIDESGQVSHLTIDDAARPLQLGRARIRHLQDLNGVPDRRQRIAQLVREHRDEFVLATVGLAQRLGRLLALDEIRRLSREDVQQSQVALRRLMRALPMRRDHSNEPSPAGDERGALHAVYADLPDTAPAPRAGHEIALLDFGHDHARAPAQ